MNDDEQYPYLIHTNRELELMLAGKKPFAVFARQHVDGFEKSDALSDQDFDRYVANNTISEQTRTFDMQAQDGSPVKVDYYFYAMKGEEWRVEAYCLLLDLLHNRGWCSHL